MESYPTLLKQVIQPYFVDLTVIRQGLKVKADSIIHQKQQEYDTDVDTIFFYLAKLTRQNLLRPG